MNTSEMKTETLTSECDYCDERTTVTHYLKINLYVCRDCERVHADDITRAHK